ncbi:Uroporphyrinogen decarboxylase [Azospirillaceae bacterium]
MTSGLDRVRAAVAGTPCDRIPVFCNLLDQGARELGIPLRQYYRDGAAVAEAQLRMREKYGHDNVWSLFYVGKEAELLGCRDILYTDDGPPNVGDFIIKDPSDIAALQIPDDLENHPDFRPALECLKILRAEVGGTYPICAYLTAATTLPAILMGMEKWMELLLMGPADLRDQLLTKCSEFFRRQLAAYRAAGADLLIYSTAFTSTDFVPLSFIRNFTLPWMERDLAPGGVADIVYYCGLSRINKALPLVLDRWNFPAVYLGLQDGIAEAKQIVNGRAVTCAPINDLRLVHWNENEVRQEVRRIIGAGKPGGHFLFGTAVMPLAIPERNIRAMVETACECGRWKPEVV